MDSRYDVSAAGGAYWTLWQIVPTVGPNNEFEASPVLPAATLAQLVTWLQRHPRALVTTDTQALADALVAAEIDARYDAMASGSGGPVTVPAQEHQP